MYRKITSRESYRQNYWYAKFSKNTKSGWGTVK